MENQNSGLPEFWSGYISGTNYGKITVSFKQKKEDLMASVIFEDSQYGITLIELTGEIRGDTADLRIIDCKSILPLSPSDGKLSLTFKDNFKSGEGRWFSNIGTHGHCYLWPRPLNSFCWKFLWHKSHISLWFQNYLKGLYGLTILIFLCLSLFPGTRGALSWPVLFLLLFPSIYIFKNELKEIIMALNIKKVGPVEFQEKAINWDFLSHLQSNPFDSEATLFYYLDQAFVPKTKLILLWLSERGTVSRDDFNRYANSENLDENQTEVTLIALIQGRCVEASEDSVKITEFGKRFLAFAMKKAIYNR